jgi:hypothetical protein
MINAVDRSSSHYIRTEQQQKQTQQPDTLTAKRAAEARQLAMAAVSQQQREKVQQAIAAYMSLGVSSPRESTAAHVPLAQSQGAYREF